MSLLSTSPSGAKPKKDVSVRESSVQTSRADGACQGRGAEGVKETAVNGVTLIDAVVASVRVGKNRLWPMCGDCVFHLRRNRGGRLVPGNALEPRPRPFRSDPPDRVE